MSLPLMLQGLGSVGVFASRAFLPAFVTALMLRFGPDFPGLAHLGLLSTIRGVPTWFTSDATLIVLGLLAALELAAERSPDAKVFLDEIHAYLKAGMAALTYLGVLNAADRVAVGRLIQEAGLLDSLPALAVAAGTYFASRARSAIVRPLVGSDEEDDLGLQRLFRWAGDAWGMLGPVALIVFPLLTILAFGFAAITLALFERRIAAQGEKVKFPCSRCGLSIHPCALFCPSCKSPVAEPRSIGLLGTPRLPPADLATLPYRLVALKRCPACATRFSGRGVDQTCAACGRRLLDDPGFVRGYIASIDRRVPLVLLACMCLGLIPVLGVIPGVIYYRLTIVAPFRRHLPRGRGFLVRWGVRLAILILVAFQWVPVAGGLALPAMALINYFAYRSAFRNLARAAGPA